MTKSFLFFIVFLLIGCTQLTIPNTPLGQVSEAFKDGEVVEGSLIGETFQIPLVYNTASAYPGWNLVARPVGVSDYTINVPYKIFHFDTATILYGTDMPKDAGIGFWIKVEKPGLLTLKGPWQTRTGQSLQGGWNQLGIGLQHMKIKDIRVRSNTLSLSLNDAEEYLIPVFYYWDSNHGEWGFINARKAESMDKELLPGVGYFVYAKKESELVWG